MTPLPRGGYTQVTTDTPPGGVKRARGRFPLALCISHPRITAPIRSTPQLRGQGVRSPEEAPAPLRREFPRHRCDVER